MRDKTKKRENKGIHIQRELRKKCEDCGTMSKVYRMFDIDGKNLVEYLTCLNCGLGAPSVK